MNLKCYIKIGFRKVRQHILSPSHSACLLHARKILYHRSPSPNTNTYITKFCKCPGYLESLWLQWWKPCNGFLSGQYFVHEAGFPFVLAVTPRFQAPFLFALFHLPYISWDPCHYIGTDDCPPKLSHKRQGSKGKSETDMAF